MLDFILQPLANFVIYLVSSFSYFGIFVIMFFQSACVPIPSEVVLPFAGFMVGQGIFNFWGVIITSVLGCFAGGTFIFMLAFYKGEHFVRNLIKKYGKYLLINTSELDEAEERFQKFGQVIVFFGRMLPVVRTFIALPAGLSKMQYSKFAVFSIAGDLIWSTLLVYLGSVMGKNWNTLGIYFKKFDLVIVFAGLLAAGWYLNHKLRKNR